MSRDVQREAKRKAPPLTDPKADEGETSQRTNSEDMEARNRSGDFKLLRDSPLSRVIERGLDGSCGFAVVESRSAH
jgi:hypothetical protein